MDPSATLRRADLNLVPALAALLDQRRVTRAAETLGICQPAMSSATNPAANSRTRTAGAGPDLDAIGYRFPKDAEPTVGNNVAAEGLPSQRATNSTSPAPSVSAESCKSLGMRGRQMDHDENPYRKYRVTERGIDPIPRGRLPHLKPLSANVDEPPKNSNTVINNPIVDTLRAFRLRVVVSNSHSTRVNSVLPGTIATPKVLALPKQDQNPIRTAIPAGRFGRPDEVANLIAFLIGDGSGCVTAQKSALSGGPELNGLFVGPTR